MTDKDMTEGSGKHTPQKTKKATILTLLASGKSLNRFDAEHHHDHCLNTTISDLQNNHGIEFHRVRESVPCLGGMATTSVNRYWLSTKPDNIKRTHDLLAYWERKE